MAKPRSHLPQDLYARFVDNNIAIIDAKHLNEEKMSEILLEFSDELLSISKTHSDRADAIVLAIVAWNASLMGPEKREAFIYGFLERMGIENQEDCEQMSMLLQLSLIHI